MRSLLIFLLTISSGVLLSAQVNTNYGQYSGGTNGTYNSHFGYRSGSSSDGSKNVSVGAFSMRFQSNGLASVGVGYQSLYRNEGTGNVGVGNATLLSNTSGDNNVGVGNAAMYNNISGNFNIGVGAESLTANKSGGFNVAVGGYALNKTTSSYNSALGYYALGTNNSGQKNTALGYLSARSNTTGSFNTTVGSEAFFNSTTANYNTVVGNQAAYKLTTANYNSVLGHQALYDNTTGYNNTSIGAFSLENNVTGGFQTATGYYSLRNVTGGFYNTGYGSYSGPSSSGSYNNTLSLGFGAAANSSNTARVGNTSMTSIGGYANWTNVSDGRFKSDVKEDVMGLDFIKALRPVSYQLDRKKIHQFIHKDNKELAGAAYEGEAEYQTGFIAQEVEAAAQKLGFDHFNGVDAPQNEASHYGLRYAEFVVPLVKSVQELSAQNEAQTQTIEELKVLVNQQQAQIEQLLNNTTGTNDIEPATRAQLYQNVPNPHQGQTQIKVLIPENAQQAFLQVTDLSGKQLMVKEIPSIGEQVLNLNTTQLEAGMYLYTLVVDQEIVATKKMIVAQ